MTVAVAGVGGLYAEPSAMTRSDKRTAAAVAAERAPQRLREKLGTDEAVDKLAEVILADMADRECKGHRTAMTLHAQILKAVGSEPDLVAALLAGYGLGSLAELEQRVAVARTLDEVGGGDADAQGIAYFRRRMRSDPAMRERLRRELFGEVGESGAVVLDESAPHSIASAPSCGEQGVGSVPTA